MSLHTRVHTAGIFVPDEMAMLQAVVHEMRGESWYPKSEDMREKFNCFVLNSYDRGLTNPVRLKAFCKVAARLYFQEHDRAH